MRFDISTLNLAAVQALLDYLQQLEPDGTKRTQSKLAARLGCHPSAVAQWIMNRRVPSERLFMIQEITGIDPRELRPDLFPGKDS